MTHETHLHDAMFELVYDAVNNSKQGHSTRDMCATAAQAIIAQRREVIRQAVQIARDLGEPEIAETIERALGAGM